jgi:ATP-dependent protease ClpP protease subunit/transcriptional regulator with XRE-family HTH domain
MNDKQTKSLYNFKAEGDQATIDIFAEIDSFWGYSAQQVKEDLQSFEGSRIVVNINSGGGSVTEGIAIANLLRGDRRHVTTRAVGIAASIASVILMAGDTVEMAPNSFLMIHNVWAEAVGESEELRKTADIMDQMSDQIANIYVESIKSRQGGTDRRTIKKDIVQMMAEETWLSPEAAKEKGLIDKIVKFKTAAPSNQLRARLYNQVKKNFKKLPSNMENQETETTEAVAEEVKNGTSLAAALQAKIDEMLAADEEMTQAMVVDMMAEAAGIDAGTVNQILRGDVNCPPLERLEGFASALKMPMTEITTAAEADGCVYGDQEETEEASSEAENCVECNKEAKAEKKGVFAKIRALLGIATKEEEKFQDKAVNDLKSANDKLSLALNQVETFRKENGDLKAELKESQKTEKEALEVLNKTKEILSPITGAQNRKGENFKNVTELLSEYQALVAHNKELGGLPVDAGAPVNDQQTTSSVDKGGQQETIQDLDAQFRALKKRIKEKNKKK